MHIDKREVDLIDLGKLWHQRGEYLTNK